MGCVRGAGTTLRPGLHSQPQGACPEHASAESLMECILESFAFLNADFAPQELPLFGGPQDPR